MIQRRSSPDDWFHKNATPKQRTNLDIYGRTLYITRARSQVVLAGGVRGLWENRPGIGSGAGIQTPMHVTTDKSQSIPSTYSFFLFPKHKTHTHTQPIDLSVVMGIVYLSTSCSLLLSPLCGPQKRGSCPHSILRFPSGRNSSPQLG